jgi:hypothetical protein
MVAGTLGPTLNVSRPLERCSITGRHLAHAWRPSPQSPGSMINSMGNNVIVWDLETVRDLTSYATGTPGAMTTCSRTARRLPASSSASSTPPWSGRASKHGPFMGMGHTVYSLRPTAICMRNGQVKIFKLAKNAGTSVEQIKRFYAESEEPAELWDRPPIARQSIDFHQRQSRRSRYRR